MSTPSSAAAVDAKLIFRFGRFSLSRSERLLLEDGKHKSLGSRTFDLLTALVERAGSVVGRDELLALVWPTTIVEETSLRFHVSALRKALGDGKDGARYIANIPGRGYIFVAQVRTDEMNPEPSVLELRPGRASSPVDIPLKAASYVIPSRLTPVVGRSAAIEAVALLVKEQRLVSIVGAGGVGKTTVAAEVARSLAQNFQDGIYWADFSAVSDPAEFPTLLASTLGVSDEGAPVSGVDAITGAIVRRVSASRTLLVLDSCEHVADSVAVLVDTVLKTAPGVSVLTTSREALDAEGEWVYRLGPLAIPAPHVDLATIDVDQFGAVQLFTERAAASAGDFVLSDDMRADVVRLCSLLDGNPLAIELAAGRISSLGVKGLIARGNELGRLLSRGMRTAQKRHSSLSECVEWSHALLERVERIVFRRLSVMRGVFDLRSAVDIVLSDDDVPDGGIACEIDRVCATEGVLSLCAKSLIEADHSNGVSRFRLLNAVRSHGAEKLLASGEAGRLRLRHARHFLDLLRRAGRSASREQAAALADRLRPDVTAALEWASSVHGDVSLVSALSDALEALLANTPRVSVRAGVADVTGVHSLQRTPASSV